VSLALVASQAAVADYSAYSKDEEDSFHVEMTGTADGSTCAEPEEGPGLSWYCVIDKPNWYYIGMGYCREEALEQSLLACKEGTDTCKAEEAFCAKFEEERR
jgi:hypothetical protein